MALYRKKPLVIEAEQWFPDKEVEGVDPDLNNSRRGIIETLEGPHVVIPGDWIITGIAGEKYPCKPDIFAETYDKVE